MVHRSRKNATRKKILTNHNRNWVWGRHVVLETLRCGRWPILQLLIGDRADDGLCDEATELAARQQIPVRYVDDESLVKECRAADHQGWAAQMAPFPYESLKSVLERSAADSAFVILDRLQDSFNFGAIIRSAAAFGIDGIIIGQKEQVEVNSLVARSSAGTVNRTAIIREDDLVQTAEVLRDRGFQILAATEKTSEPLEKANLCGPTVLIIGNEGRGIRTELMAVCDRSYCIPMTDQVGSLNAAVAAGITFYEIRRQRTIYSTKAKD